MIKIKIKNKNSLNEVEMKHSKTALDEIYNLCMKGMKEDKKVWNQLVYVPISEIINKTNSVINGLPVFVTRYLNKDISTLVNTWDSKTKQFNQQTQKEFQNFKLPILFVYFSIPDDNNNGTFGLGGTNKEGLTKIFRLMINPHSKEHNFNPETISSTIRHELQHLTDATQKMCLDYYKELLKTPNDITKVPNLLLSSDTTRPIKTKSKLQTNAPNPTNYEEFKNYIRNDEEYKPWLSDTIDAIISWLSSDKKSMNDALQKALHLDAFYNSNLKQRQQIKKSVDLTNAYTFNDISNYYVKLIFTDEKFRDWINTRFRGFKVFIENMDESRLKYIRKDLSIGLAKRFKMLAQQM